VLAFVSTIMVVLTLAVLARVEKALDRGKPDDDGAGDA
jgi:hypothetical protein